MNPKSLENLIPFKPGQSGNPAGRPKGSRDQFNEAFIRDLQAVWDAKGKQSLEELKPEDLARIAAQVLSKESKVGIEHSGAVEHRGLPDLSGRADELLDRQRPSPPLLPN